MSIINKFSRKIFCFITILFCYTSYGDVLEPEIARQRSAMDTFYNHHQTICSSGYYLSACNQITVGTNWLKGIKGTNETPDYYSYNSNASDNMTNLRKFFGGIEIISYKPENSNETETVDSSVYLTHRNKIFETFCTVKNMKCEKCPNNANIPESTVNIGNYTGKILEWNIHTIADCYMDEFSDNTGTYVYAKSDDPDATKQRCYYLNNIQGDELVSE